MPRVRRTRRQGQTVKCPLFSTDTNDIDSIFRVQHFSLYVRRYGQRLRNVEERFQGAKTLTD